MSTNEQDLSRFVTAGAMRDFATYIERNIALPLPARVEINYIVIRDTDDAERAEIDRIGRVLGTTPVHSHDQSHYTVSRRFGTVVYTAIAITAEYMERYALKLRAADRYERETWGDQP